MKRVLFLLALLAATCISYAQKVGIGTTTPAEKLDVAGNLKADTIKPNALKLTGNAGLGKILTSDASGNASWQARSTGGGVGFGSWGDCSMNNVVEYSPVADTAGATDDNFGWAVAISGSFAFVGAYGDNIGANADQGSVNVYQHNGSNWVFLQKLTDITPATTEYFGYCVAVSGNFAIIGIPTETGVAGLYQGSACIYQYNGSSWVFMQKITDPAGLANDFFGTSVSISGNYAMVGVYNDDEPSRPDQGSALIFQYNGSSWVFMQKLIDPAGAQADWFGASVSISGNLALVGTPQDDESAGGDQGSVSLYQYNGSSWVLTQKLTDATAAAGDRFGTSVSISGNYAIIGASRDDVDVNSDQGSASFYKYNGTTWTLMQKITDATGGAGDYYGWSVSMSGNYAIVGAYNDDIGANGDQGSAHIYLRVGQRWQKLQDLVDPGGMLYDQFGSGTAIDGTTQRFLIGATNADGNGRIVFGKVN